MRRPPLISLSVKVGLVLFAVVAGALAIVYLAVVPRLENRLVDAKIHELEQAAPRVAPGRGPWSRGAISPAGDGERSRQRSTARA